MIDSLPTDWKRKKIIDIGKISTSSVNKKIDPNETEINLINYMDVYSSISKKITSGINFMRVTASDNQLLKNQVKKGDVLFTPSSETPDDIGISAVVYEELPNTLYSYHLVRLAFSENIDLDYKRYIFNSPFVLNKFSRISQGLTRFTISQKDFNETKILIPPLSEQRKIAAVLSMVNDAIEKSDAIIEETKQLKKGLMQKLFIEGIGHLRFKDTKVGKVPEAWEVVKLGDVCNKENTKFEPRDSTQVYPYIGLEHIASNSHKLIGIGKSNETLSTKNVFKKGDILYGKLRPYLNKVWQANIDGVCTTEILVLNSNEKANQKFLYFLFQQKRFVSFANSLTEGTSLPRINWKDITKFKVILPSLREQQQIAQIISEIDYKIEKEIATQEQLEKLKKGLMQVLLTGKIRVKI